MSAFDHIQHAALSDIGRRRTNNEDSYGVFPAVGVFCVADGMGGGDDGEVASAATVKAIETFAAQYPLPTNATYPIDDYVDALCAAVDSASSWVYRRAQEKHLKGCGSTFVGVCFDAARPDVALALHAGDSRLYRICGRSIQQITKDHSAAELIGAKDESEVNPMFRGMILRAVGIQPDVDVDRTEFPIKSGDRILICSDGLSRMVPDKMLLAISRKNKSPDDAVSAFVSAANDAGGIDNVTAVVVDVGELPPPLPSTAMPVHKQSGNATAQDAHSERNPAVAGTDGDSSFDADTAEPFLDGFSSETMPGGETSTHTLLTASSFGVRKTASTVLGDPSPTSETTEETDATISKGLRNLLIAGIASAFCLGLAVIAVMIAGAHKEDDVPMPKIVVSVPDDEAKPTGKAVPTESQLAKEHRKTEEEKRQAEEAARIKRQTEEKRKAEEKKQKATARRKTQNPAGLKAACTADLATKFRDKLEELGLKNVPDALFGRLELMADRVKGGEAKQACAEALTRDLQTVATELLDYASLLEESDFEVAGQDNNRAVVRDKVLEFREVAKRLVSGDPSDQNVQKDCATMIYMVPQWF